MRVSFNHVLIAALLGSLPFAGLARGYPAGGAAHSDAISKRAEDPFRDPSPAPSDPFRDPSTTPESPGSPAAAKAWGQFADGDLKLGDAGSEAARSKGEQYMTSLRNAITENAGSDKVDQSMKDAGYTGQGSLNEKPDVGGNKKPLAEFNLNTDKNFRGDDIKKPGSTTIVKTYEDPDQKLIIVGESWNKAQDPQGKLSWTAMVFSNWKAAAGTTKVKNLQWIDRNNVQSIDTTSSDGKVKLNTQTAMIGAFNALKADRAKTLTLDASSTDKTTIQQFMVMAAQTHVARVYQMLQDYRIELGDLTVAKLHLQSPQNPASNDQWNLIIELGHQ